MAIRTELTRGRSVQRRGGLAIGGAGRGLGVGVGEAMRAEEWEGSGRGVEGVEREWRVEGGSACVRSEARAGG